MHQAKAGIEGVKLGAPDSKRLQEHHRLLRQIRFHSEALAFRPLQAVRSTYQSLYQWICDRQPLPLVAQIHQAETGETKTNSLVLRLPRHHRDGRSLKTEMLNHILNMRKRAWHLVTLGYRLCLQAARAEPDRIPVSILEESVWHTIIHPLERHPTNRTNGTIGYPITLASPSFARSVVSKMVALLGLYSLSTPKTVQPPATLSSPAKAGSLLIHSVSRHRKSPRRRSRR